jgi:hypothetical protein
MLSQKAREERACGISKIARILAFYFHLIEVEK